MNNNEVISTLNELERLVGMLVSAVKDNLDIDTVNGVIYIFDRPINLSGEYVFDKAA